MISFPRIPSTALSTQAYQRRITGQGQTYLQRQRTRVNCPKCDKSFQYGNLANHLKQVHKELPTPELPPQHNPTSSLPINVPTRLLYTISIPNPTATHACPIPECATPIKSRSGMRSHFNHRHPYNYLLILEEGYLPRCPKCLLHTRELTKHQFTKRCHLGSTREEHRQLEHD